jgi:hypothetical protein
MSGGRAEESGPNTSTMNFSIPFYQELHKCGMKKLMRTASA